jgi:Glycosyltransferase family 9 (heptosyltransferase)
MPVALVSAARGIGDILRITPLVRICRRLGYQVDLLLAPDYPEAVSLVEGHEDVGRVFVAPSAWRQKRVFKGDGIPDTTYDVATFTTWSHPYRPLVRARRSFVFDQQQWIREGDTASIRRIAASLGWTGSLPAPFAVPSERRFDLPEGTVALHPGCKPDWPWKKWHGFEELAQRLPSVVIVGSHEDQRNERTYFSRRLVWPAHARDFSGTLTLADTAAAIQQCSALVANDSGLMHLGVALGVPTFGIFGITSPRREAIDAPNMHVITKGLPCEAACHIGPWGRRDCDRHLECLRTLHGDAVFERVASELSRGPKERTWTS